MRKISSKLTTREKPDLPPEIGQFINGRSVRLAEPERYFARHWRLQVPFLGEEIKEMKPNLFTLEPTLFADFISDLRSLLARREAAARKGDSLYADFRDPDWIPWALLVSCSLDKSFVPVAPYFEYDRQVVRIPPDSSSSEQVTASTQQPNHQSVAMTMSFGPDPENDDELSLLIEFSGEPLGALKDMREIDKHSPQRRLFQKKAENVWDFLIQAMEARLGIEGPSRGRPMRNAGKTAAFGHHHCGLTWSQVAQQLCPEKHAHGPLCRDNYRKQASQYWERERKRYAALAQNPSTPDGEQEDPGPSA
jgi:hypothetical protein